jgi:hypothetical protein
MKPSFKQSGACVRSGIMTVILGAVFVLGVWIAAAIVVFRSPPKIQQGYSIWRNAGLVTLPMGGGVYIVEVVPGTNYVMQIHEEQGRRSIWKKFWSAGSYWHRYHRSCFLLLGQDVTDGMQRDLHVANDTIDLSGSRGSYFEFLGEASSGDLHVVLRQPSSSSVHASVSGEILFNRFNGDNSETEMISLDLDEIFQIRSLEDYHPLWGSGGLADTNAVKKWGAK